MKFKSNIRVAERALGFTVKHRHLRRVCVGGAQARIQDRPFSALRLNKLASVEKLLTERFTIQMAKYESQTITSDVNSGKMIYEPILEDGVFRFDCSADDRNGAFSSISFVNSRDRDTPIMNDKVPLYIPTFECIMGQ